MILSLLNYKFLQNKKVLFRVQVSSVSAAAKLIKSALMILSTLPRSEPGQCCFQIRHCLHTTLLVDYKQQSRRRRSALNRTIKLQR